MALDRAAAFRTDRTHILALLRDLSDSEWAAPSKGDGGAVRDVVSHLGAACHGTFTPWVLKLLAGRDIEAANDRDAERRRSREPARLLREYEVWGKRVEPAPIEFRLAGFGGGTWTVSPGSKRVKATAGSTETAGETLEGPAASFPIWGTAREPWREAGVALKGDDELGTRFLDSLRII